MTEFNNFSNKDNLKQNNFNNCENAELDDKLNDCNIENNKNENSKSLKNDCNNDTDKIFSKNYFQHKFSKTYLKSGISNMWRKYTMFLTIITFVLIVDLVLKSVFDLKTYDFIKGFISIDGFAHNTGAAFSLFSNATIFLLVLSIVCLIAYLLFEYLTMDNKRGYTYYIATALMVAGTVGNMVDRVAFGYVRDFIKLEFIDFPIFNIADCALTVGVILLAIWLIFLQPKEVKKDANN